MSEAAVKKRFADALCWLINQRIKSLRKSVRNDNKTVRTIIEGTSIAELKLLSKLIKKMKL